MNSIKLSFLLLLFSAKVLLGQNPEEINKLYYFDNSIPEDIPRIFAPGIVSTEQYNHSGVTFSPSGDEIYWAMGVIDKTRHIYFSKFRNGTWSEPEILHFTITESGDCPVISADGETMYFNSNRKIEPLGSSRERIWKSERISTGWSKPEPLGPVINKEHLHWQCGVDPNGNLYFGSERKGSKGRDDIFMARWDKKKFLKPVSLPSPVNSPEHEGCPFISQDGKYMLFYRDGLKFCHKLYDNTWGNPIPIDFKGIKGGNCPSVSPDGKYLFFLVMGMGINDVYWVKTENLPGFKDL